MSLESKTIRPSISLVIPCLNEQDSIPWVAENIERNLLRADFQNSVSKIEVLIVDDGSEDQSLELLSKIPFIKVINNTQARGYGAALKFGFAQCQTDYVAFLDMDKTYVPGDLKLLLETAVEQNLDMIYGTRLCQHKAEESGMPQIRKWGNRMFVYLLKILFNSNLHDVCTGYRVFRREKLSEILEISENGLNFSIALTIVSLKNKWRIKEIPITYLERGGVSKLSVIKDGISFLMVILKRFATPA